MNTTSLREGPVTMQAAVLPARAVYLTAEGSRLGFIRAVTEATNRWAGMTEPIVQVAADGAISTEQAAMVGYADVQAAVNVDVDPGLAQRAANELRLPLYDLDQAASLATSTPSAVRNPPQFHSAGGRIFPYPQQQYAHSAADDPLWQIAALGCAPQGTHTSRLAAGRPDVWQMQLERTSALDLTIEQFGDYRCLEPCVAPAVLWISEPESLPDCLAFWNLRALRPVSGVDMPIVLFTPEVVAWEGSTGQLGRMLKRPGQFTPDAVVMTKSVLADNIAELAEFLELTLTTDEPAASPPCYPQGTPRQPPFTYGTDVDPARWVLQERNYGLITSFDVHLIPGRPTTMQIPSPVMFREPGQALLRICGAPLDGLPRRSKVADLMGVSAAWSRDGDLQVAVNTQDSWRFQLLIPSLAQATRALIDAVNPENYPSVPGRLAAALQGRSDMTLLLDAGVYESANALRTPRSGQLLKDLEEAAATSDAGRAELVEIASQWGGRAERRFLTASQIPVPRDIALTALEELCLMGWAERGLQASCDACGITSFHPAAQTSHQPACPACSAPVRYTQDTGNLSTHYRLNGLVDRAADHGVPAHLLVIAALTREKPQSHFLPGTQLPFTTDDDPEVDIFGVWDGIVLAGEVKNSSADFTTVQLKRDVALSKRLGADVHLLAAVDTVDPETVEQAQTLCVEAGLQLEVWDKTRLRPGTTETKAVDTATDTFERVRRALAALTGEVDKNPTRAARKSGFFLRTAMEPRSPSAGQVEALTAVINQYGAELAAPVAALDQALSELLAACDKPGAV